MDVGCTLDLGKIIDLGCFTWTSTSASRAVSAVAELFVCFCAEDLDGYPSVFEWTVNIVHRYCHR